MLLCENKEQNQLLTTFNTRYHGTTKERYSCSYSCTQPQLRQMEYFKDNYVPANCVASSVDTSLKWCMSHLVPTSMMTMLVSVWSLKSFNHSSTLLYVMRLVMLYTRRAPTAPR